MHKQRPRRLLAGVTTILSLSCSHPPAPVPPGTGIEAQLVVTRNSSVVDRNLPPGTYTVRLDPKRRVITLEGAVSWSSPAGMTSAQLPISQVSAELSYYAGSAAMLIVKVPPQEQWSMAKNDYDLL
jgi:hypothetical protein